MARLQVLQLQPAPDALRAVQKPAHGSPACTHPVAAARYCCWLARQRRPSLARRCPPVTAPPPPPPRRAAPLGQSHAVGWWLQGQGSRRTGRCVDASPLLPRQPKRPIRRACGESAHAAAGREAAPRARAQSPAGAPAAGLPGPDSQPTASKAAEQSCLCLSRAGNVAGQLACCAPTHARPGTPSRQLQPPPDSLLWLVSVVMVGTSTFACSTAARSSAICSIGGGKPACPRSPAARAAALAPSFAAPSPAAACTPPWSAAPVAAPRAAAGGRSATAAATTPTCSWMCASPSSGRSVKSGESQRLRESGRSNLRHRAAMHRRMVARQAATRQPAPAHPCSLAAAACRARIQGRCDVATRPEPAGMRSGQEE